MLKLRLWYFGPLIRRADSLEKTLMLGEIGDRRRRGRQTSPTRWTWVWVNFGSWWLTGRPDVLQFMGLQRVGHDWATELNWTNINRKLEILGWPKVHSGFSVRYYGKARMNFLANWQRHTCMHAKSLSLVRLLVTPWITPGSTPGLPVHHQFPEFTQTHVHWVGDAIQPSHPLSSPSPPAPNPSQHQSLFQWVNSLHEVAKVLEFQL